jgi:predicted nucleotidyltransferase
MKNLARFRDDILRIAARYGATNVRVSGLDADGDEASTLDVIVDMGKDRSLFDLVELGHELEDLLGRPVEVLSAASLNPRLRSGLLAGAQEL